jgi:hypothetical protein
MPLTFAGGLGAVSPPRTQRFTPQVVTFTRIQISHAAAYANFTVGANSPTGHLVVMFVSRYQGSIAPTGTFSSVTWGGDALTQVLNPVKTGSQFGGTGVGYAGYIRGGLTGLRNLVVTPDATELFDAIGWIVSLDRLHESDPIGASQGTTVKVLQSAYDLTLNCENSQSLLLGGVAALNDDAHPLSISAGWTLVDGEKTGNAGGGDIAGVLGRRVAGATGNVSMTATANAGFSTDDWCRLALEILPA